MGACPLFPLCPGPCQVENRVEMLEDTGIVTDSSAIAISPFQCTSTLEASELQHIGDFLRRHVAKRIKGDVAELMGIHSDAGEFHPPRDPDYCVSVCRVAVESLEKEEIWRRLDRELLRHGQQRQKVLRHGQWRATWNSVRDTYELHHVSTSQGNYEIGGLREFAQLCLRQEQLANSRCSLKISVVGALDGKHMLALRCLQADTIADTEINIASRMGFDTRSCCLRLMYGDQILSKGWDGMKTIGEVGICKDSTISVLKVACEVVVVQCETLHFLMDGKAHKFGEPKRDTSGLLTMEMPQLLTMDTDVGFLRILQGLPVQPFESPPEVGQSFGFRQEPSQSGDTWSINFLSQAVSYNVEIITLTGPDCGIVSVYMDDEQIGQVDQYSLDLSMRTHVLQWSAAVAGRHTLKVSTLSKHAHSSGYDFRVYGIALQPIPANGSLGP